MRMANVIGSTEKKDDGMNDKQPLTKLERKPYDSDHPCIGTLRYLLAVLLSSRILRLSFI